jgi:hypothetical protein
MDRKKYIVEASDDVKKVMAIGVTRGGAIWTDTTDIENLEELNSDYINEHYGELQDEAYQRGFEDGKNQKENSIEVGDEVEDSDGDKTIVTNIHGNLFDGLCSDGSVMSDLFLDDNHKTGKHYDIASILEAMRT